MCMFCNSLFLLSLCCPFFFGIRILITPLVSSNSSYIDYIKLNIVFEMGYSDANSCQAFVLVNISLQITSRNMSTNKTGNQNQ